MAGLAFSFARHEKAVATVMAGLSILPALTGVSTANASEIDLPVVNHEPGTHLANTLLFGDAESVELCATESHIDGPKGRQKVSIKHFETDAEGKVIGLSGPRVKIVLPDEIVTKLSTFNLSEALETVPVNLDKNIAPSGAREFCFEDENIILNGATTAFYATTKVAESADKFAGHMVKWGHDGQLTVVPYKFVVNFFNAYFDGITREMSLGALGSVTPDGRVVGMTGRPNGWENDVENVLLDSARGFDIVAHEAAHAALSGVKPAFFSACHWPTTRDLRTR